MNEIAILEILAETSVENVTSKESNLKVSDPGKKLYKCWLWQEDNEMLPLMGRGGLNERGYMKLLELLWRKHK